MSSKSYDHSGVHLFRNGAFLVIDCSGCLYYRTERQVSNLVLLLYFLSQLIWMSKEHLFLLKGTEYWPTPNWRDVISQWSMK